MSRLRGQNRRNGNDDAVAAPLHFAK
jgi:hypothetical protein